MLRSLLVNNKKTLNKFRRSDFDIRNHHLHHNHQRKIFKFHFHHDDKEFTKPGYNSEPQFACRMCGKKYRWKSTMRRHEQFECGGKEPIFQCPFCPYKAKQKGNLGVHVRKHHYL